MGGFCLVVELVRRGVVISTGTRSALEKTFKKLVAGIQDIL